MNITREERIAIMIIDGGVSEAEAVAYCDSTDGLKEGE
jgi:hypothetical protein